MNQVPNRLDKFFKLIDRQFSYGGQKYALDNTRESTDLLFDDFSPAWVYGTQCKYVKRFMNLRRSRDLLKVATYAYLMWLKRGFHIQPEGTMFPIDTTVKNKSESFHLFQKIVSIYKEEIPYNQDVSFEEVYEILTELVRVEQYVNGDFVATTNWNKLTEEKLCDIFFICYQVWNKEFGHLEICDEDVYNEDKK